MVKLDKTSCEICMYTFYFPNIKKGVEWGEVYFKFIKYKNWINTCYTKTLYVYDTGIYNCIHTWKCSLYGQCCGKLKTTVLGIDSKYQRFFKFAESSVKNFFIFFFIFSSTIVFDVLKARRGASF